MHYVFRKPCLAREATLLTVWILLLAASCSRKKEEAYNPLKPEIVKRISSAKTFEDLFVLEKEVQLETRRDCVLADLKGLSVLPNSDFVVCDGRTVCIFSPEGNFLKRVGQTGKGPGEYEYPEDLASDQQGNIYVYDSSLGRITVFDAAGYFIRAFGVHFSGVSYGMKVNSVGATYLLHSLEASSGQLIHSYNANGQLLRAFCTPPNQFQGLTLHAVAGGIAIDRDDNVYEIDITSHQIKKYSPRGELIKIFGRKPDFYISIEPPIKLDRLEDLSQILDTHTLNEGVYVFDSGILMVEMRNLDARRMSTDYLEFYDTEGNFLSGGIRHTLLGTFMATYGDTIFAVMAVFPDSSGNLPNPKIRVYKLAVG